ncbi:MAG: hypothetical protein KDD75_12885, partial [Caldilineaceae bacterium]|nr:hypothetical protein [Caldilineaceae bacterium]
MAASRKALGDNAVKLQALHGTLSLAAHRAGGPAVGQMASHEPVSATGWFGNTEAVMPAGVLKIWLETKDGKSLAEQIAVFADNAVTLSSDTGADAAVVAEDWQELVRQNNTRIHGSLVTMRDAMNAALLAENDANRNIIGLATGAFLAAAVLLLLVLPVAMMRRLRKGQATAPALAGSTVPLSAHRRSDRVKLGFLANLDTEVRTSVSGVTAMAELLARTELDDQQRGCVDVIAKSGQALFELTSGALDYARADS